MPVGLTRRGRLFVPCRSPITGPVVLWRHHIAAPRPAKILLENQRFHAIDSFHARTFNARKTANVAFQLDFRIGRFGLAAVPSQKPG